MSDVTALFEAIRAAVAHWPPWVVLIAAALAAILTAFVLHRGVLLVLGRAARHSKLLADESFHRRCDRPLALVALLICLRVAAESVLDPEPGAAFATLRVGLILAVGWLATRLSLVLEDSVLAQLDLDAPDNLSARRIYTQIRFLRRLVVVGVVILTGGAILLSFDSLRQIGAGLLTSAGIAGVVVGFAAQRTVGNLIAGFQIAFTQPIRTDDVVVVEGEWGRIEEITLTYVVVKIWDERRLVLPISYFIEKPFQNWTRVSAELLGTVFLQVDYRVPVDELRTELQRLLEASPQWDGRVASIQVTEARERTLELRALMSARDSGAAWQLRCDVREQLVRYLQEHHPDSLPRLRTEVHPPPTARDRSSGEPPTT